MQRSKAGIGEDIVGVSPEWMERALISEENALKAIVPNKLPGRMADPALNHQNKPDGRPGSRDCDRCVSVVILP
jgi:hypothetical protein